ncbi:MULTISPECIES: malate dehydrogenase [Cytobacillus]|uniref:malate dehydrogenase n=1 Tax=Cytobacillus TaxID=2675230 RepID=UPI001C243A03|nr:MULTISPECIES: malate dehydrogenase [Cytobacillus]MBY0156301.1 malate dehydrogenase [Cytobacillus firmus]MBU8728541.1 malate dehydrogenase [Cytobacillus oceanisediminis]MCM3392449.1 malate dehydrogenase [Cytobacillus oceanisediminis]MCM3530831.1 malate dehydrogenase [Cytobacillus oceanisediminis]UQX55517.1 malate dehydrogenase [Cytobacillus pseudoceanisediminis]
MTFKRRKIAVIGSGFTGATAALMLAQKELGDIILVDIPSQTNPTKGKALDMLEAGPIQRFNASITGTSSYEDIQDADLVLITAGMPRKPGMSRDDLVAVNEKIMIEVSQNIKTYAPESYIIVLSNPVDAMTFVCYKTTGFPKNRVIGQSGVLDTARFNTFVAQELGVSIEDISGFVLGGHGDDMVPLVRYSYAGGIPLEKILPADRIKAIVERTRKGGGEIVNLLGQGSAYYAPAASMVEMAESILKDKKRILPSIAYLEGEYGYSNIYLGVPTILGGNGIESVIEIPLTADEKKALDQSVKSVQNVMSILETAKA